MQRKNRSKGFTLVEILIVVIILGILAAIVIPQFTNASTDARRNSLTSQLQTMRSQLELYKLQHNDELPAFAGSTPADQWAQMTGKTDVAGATTGTDFGPYLQQIPTNPLNSNSAIVAITGADPVFDGSNVAAPAGTDLGFVVNTDNGKVWATNANAGFYFDETTGTIVTP